jgi:NitT/TauT family transport system substrate-binding protein
VICNRRVWMVGAASLGLSSGVKPRAALMDSPLLIRTQGADQIRLLPVTLAHHLGYFRDEGLDVTLAPVPADAVTLDALARVPAVVFAGTFERTLCLNAIGQSHTAFALVSGAPQVVLGSSALHMPAGTRLADLPGTQLGVKALGSLSHRVAQWSLLSAGLGADDVHFVELPDPQQARRALNSGAVQALCVGDPLATQLELAGLFRIMTDTRTPRDTAGVFGGPMACTCLSAPSSFVDTQPEVVQALTMALLRALHWLRTAAPADLLRHIPPGLSKQGQGVFVQAFFRSRHTLSPDGLFTPAAVANALRALERLGLPLNWSQVSLESSYTNRFVSRARRHVRA